MECSDILEFYLHRYSPIPEPIAFSDKFSQHIISIIPRATWHNKTERLNLWKAFPEMFCRPWLENEAHAEELDDEGEAESAEGEGGGMDLFRPLLDTLKLDMLADLAVRNRQSRESRHFYPNCTSSPSRRKWVKIIV
jgi:hypothetical protein